MVCMKNTTPNKFVINPVGSITVTYPAQWITIPNGTCAAGTGGNIIFNAGTGTSSGGTIIFKTRGPVNPGAIIIDGYTPTDENLCAKEACHSAKEGCNCKKCKEYFPYAEPNQEDGSLICYSCRNHY